MKRVFKVLLVLIVALMPFVAVSAKTTKTTTTTAAKIEGKKVNFYVFHGNGCSHCADLLAYLTELDKDPEYNYMYDLVKYEVWYNAENASLMTSVFKYFGVTDENKMGVPLYVIGDQYFNGFPNSSQTEAYNKATQEIKDALKKAYTDANYTDIVAGIGSGSIDPDDSKANEKDTKNTNNIIGYVIIGLVVIVVIAIIFGRHSSDVYYPTEEEDDEEETTKEEPVKKEVVTKTVAKKVPVKKTATKAPAKKTTAVKKTTKTTSTKKTATKKNTKKK